MRIARSVGRLKEGGSHSKTPDNPERWNVYRRELVNNPFTVEKIPLENHWGTGITPLTGGGSEHTPVKAVEEIKACHLHSERRDQGPVSVKTVGGERLFRKRGKVWEKFGTVARRKKKETTSKERVKHGI